MWRTLACSTIVLLSLATLAAAKCGNDVLRIDSRDGHNAIGLQFSFDSRVEKHTATSHMYHWCITNEEMLPTRFTWGTDTAPSLFFGALVLPTMTIPNSWSDSSGYGHDYRTIAFRRSDSTNWQSIRPDTIFYNHSNAYNELFDYAHTRYQTVQASPLDYLTDYLTPDGLVDLLRLSNNQRLFDLFLQNEGTVQFSGRSTMTIPANFNSMNALDESRYKEYDPSDFISLDFNLSNTIFWTSNGPRVEVSIASQAKTEADAKRLSSFQLPISLSLLPAPGRIPLPPFASIRPPAGFAALENVSPAVERVLFNQAIYALYEYNAIVTVRNDKSGSIYFRMPVRLFISRLAPP